MSEPTHRTVRRRRAAARLRVRGASWKDLAKQFGYKNETTARDALTGRYPDLWRREYDAQRALYADEMEAEANVMQRELMRHQYVKRDPHGQPVLDEDGEPVMVDVPPNVRQSAANSVKSHVDKLRGQADPADRGKVDLTELYRTAKEEGLLEDDGTGEAQSE